MLAVWVRNQDWWVFISEKTPWQFTICLFVEFWRFLNFQLELRLENRLATSRRRIWSRRNNRSPTASRCWYITLDPIYYVLSCGHWSVMAYARVNSICNTLFLLPFFLFIPETPVQKRCQVVSLFQAVSGFSNRIIFCGLKEYYLDTKDTENLPISWSFLCISSVTKQNKRPYCV